MQVLGIGRFSTVYSSKLLRTGEDVAVKIIKVDISTLLHDAVAASEPL